MKKIPLLIIMSAHLLYAHAQLLKKFKEKVNNAVDKTVGGNNSSTANAGSTKNGTATASTPSSAPFNFGKYNITTVITYNSSDIKAKTHDFYQAGTTYSSSNHTITGRVVIFSTDRNMGEAGGFEKDDKASIYENGKLIATSTVGAVQNDQSISSQYKYQFYPFYYTGNDQPVKMYPSLTFNGKNYGEYIAVMGAVVDKEKSRFYSVAGASGKDDVTYYFISSDGKKIKLPSLSSGMLINYDLSNAAVYGFVDKLEKEEKKTDVLNAAANTLNVSDVYFIDGRVLKNVPNIANGWLDMSGRNILKADRQAGNYINGKKIGEPGSNDGEIWSNAAGNGWAYLTVGGSTIQHLIFSDGADVPNPMHPQELMMDGKYYMVWLQYRNLYDGDLLLCSKEL